MAAFYPEKKELVMADKNQKVKKENRFKRWWRETVGELRKVTWPTPREAWRLTKIVLLVMVIMGAVLGGLDFMFTKLVGLVLG
jgi:preprotein translocase subunit SecE